MFDGLLQSFAGSKQGQAAMQQLGAQGFSPQQATGMISTALPVAAQTMQSAMSGGLLGGGGGAGGAQPMGLTDIGQSDYIMNFMGAAVAGLIRGEGFGGAAIDGLQGVVGGHVAQVIASRCGLPKRTAGLVGAVLTPLLIDFLWDKFKGKPKEEPPQPTEAEKMQQQMQQMQMQQMQAMQQQMAMMQQQMMGRGGGGPGPISGGGSGYGYARPQAQLPAPMYDPAAFNPYTAVEFAPVSQNFYSAYRK